MCEIEPAPDEVEYACPSCGASDSVHRSERWKTIRCQECQAVILNEDIDRL